MQRDRRRFCTHCRGSSIKRLSPKEMGALSYQHISSVKTQKKNRNSSLGFDEFRGLNCCVRHTHTHTLCGYSTIASRNQLWPLRWRDSPTNHRSTLVLWVCVCVCGGGFSWRDCDFFVTCVLDNDENKVNANCVRWKVSWFCLCGADRCCCWSLRTGTTCCSHQHNTLSISLLCCPVC